MIKAIFFDYDGVLTTDKTGSLTTCRYLSRATGIEFADVKSAFDRPSRDLTLGRTTHALVWQSVGEQLGRALPFDLLAEAFESTPVNSHMLALARALKPRYRIGIITDNKRDRIDHLKRTQHLDDLFSPIVVSAEVGADKQGAEIFLHALSRAGVKAEESVFIDNSRKNLVAPGALGFKTIFHDDEANDIPALIESLKALGVDPQCGNV